MADYTIQGADPRWKRFEKLVAWMLATLSTGAEVVYDDAIRGKLSEADRQIDVSVRSRVERPSIASSSSRVTGRTADAILAHHSLFSLA